MVSIVSITLLFIISMVSVEGALEAVNCGSGSDVIRLTGFQISAHPVNKPVVVLFGLNVQLSQDMAHPIQTDILLETKVLFFWVKAPCTNGAGSCSYPAWCDLCSTCNCPLKAGNHVMTMPMNITTAVPSGEYRAQITFRSASGQTGCVKITGIQVN